MSPIGVPVVTCTPCASANTPDRMRTWSGSCRCVVKRDCPGRRLSRKGWMSASLSAMPGGQPSTTQPIAGPWLSPKVVTRNRCPKLLCDMVRFYGTARNPSNRKSPRPGLRSSIELQDCGEGAGPMGSTAFVRARIDEKLKDEASEVLAEFGLTVSDIVRMTLTRVAKDRAVPLELKV